MASLQYNIDEIHDFFNFSIWNQLVISIQFNVTGQTFRRQLCHCPSQGRNLPFRVDPPLEMQHPSQKQTGSHQRCSLLWKWWENMEMCPFTMGTTKQTLVLNSLFFETIWICCNCLTIPRSKHLKFYNFMQSFLQILCICRNFNLYKCETIKINKQIHWIYIPHRSDWLVYHLFSQDFFTGDIVMA